MAEMWWNAELLVIAPLTNTALLKQLWENNLIELAWTIISSLVSLWTLG